VEPRLVEGLERKEPRRRLRHVLEGLDGERVADLAKQARGQPRAEQHEHGDAVGGGREKDRAEQRDRGDHEHREHQPEARADRTVGPPVARDPGDEHGGRVDKRDVCRRDRGRPGEAAQQQARPPHRPYHERLEQASLGIPADGAERQEDREHRPEEEGREHRQPEQGRPGQDAIVDLIARLQRVDLVERDCTAEGVQGEEADREQEHHQDHAAPHRLSECVAGHDERAAHAAPTASR
jgi:hypothetical protein